MINWRHTVGLVTLSTLIALGGCKKKSADLDEMKVEALSVKDTADKNVIRKMLKVEDRNVSEADANAALSAMGLSEKGAKNWDSKKGKTGDYQYKNLTFKSKDDKNVHVANVSLQGVRMENDEPTFDLMSLSKVKIDDETTKGTIDSVTFSRPNPKMAAKILDALGNMDSLDDLDIDLDIEDGEFGFGAMLMEGMNIKGDDSTLQVKSFGWGTDEDSGKGAFLAENISVTGDSKQSGKPFSLSLKSMSAEGVDMELMSEMKDGKNFNPMRSGYGNLNLSDFKMGAENFSLNLEGFQSRTDTKNGVTTERQVLKPLRMAFSGPVNDPSLKRAQKSFADLGLDNIELNGQMTKILDSNSDTLTISDSFLSMRDGFDLTYNLEARGLENAARSGSGDDVSLSRMKLELTDKSVVDRVINLVAAQQNTTPKAVKIQAKAGLAAMAFTGNAELSDGLSKMIDDGGTLTVEINPPQPLSPDAMKDVQSNPFGITKKLGLRVTHRQ